MRTTVSFEYPAPFVGADADGGGVLSVEGAGWFASLLSSIPELDVDSKLCQEDWGVVVFTKRQNKQFDFYFWDGLAEEPTRSWVAEVNYGDFFRLQRFIPGGKQELHRLVRDFNEALVRSPNVSNIAWFSSSLEAFSPKGQSFSAPE
jgi:hypothetical protein